MPLLPLRPRVCSTVAFAGLAVSLSAASVQPPSRPAAAAAGALAAAPGDELPIRRITLYRSGVGFFQRGGAVTGDAMIPLRFKTDQINDILKTLVLLDLGGGRVDAVSYASKDPLDRRMASFGIKIGDNPAAGELLGRLRGTPVRLTTPEGEVSGTVLNVEKRPTVLQGTSTGPSAVADLPWINLVTAKGVRSVNLTTVSGFEILDKELAEELNKALGALAEYRAESTKNVDVSFSGNGTRQVVVAYVHEMPVWKTSYRLILPEEKATTGTLQGWAVVENTTDQDWTDVRLALVAGRPVSFQMDLYEPLYSGRPTLPVPMVAGVMPREYQEGVNTTLGLALRAPEAEKRMVLKQSGRGGGGGGQSPFRDDQMNRERLAWMDSPQTDLKGALTADDLSSYSAAAQAQVGTVGEVFQYELQNPVTIERQRSAMIPILSSPLQARRVSIFNPADGSDHPMRGVEIRNTADLQLLPGPIAVFEGAEGTGSAYAGDATIGHIPQGDKRLLAYAVDLEVAVLTKPESTSTVTHLRIVDGMLESMVKQQHSIVYGFENKDAKRARTVVVEHPRLADWTLVEPKSAAETTQSLLRFELPIEPGQTGTLKVLQERIQSQRAQVMSMDMPTVLEYRQQGKLSEAVVNAFQEVARRQSLVNESERAIAELDRQMQSIGQDQGRIRENIRSIDRQSELYARYSKKLLDQETELEALAGRRAQTQATLEQRRADLAAYLKNLSVE